MYGGNVLSCLISCPSDQWCFQKFLELESLNVTTKVDKVKLTISPLAVTRGQEKERAWCSWTIIVYIGRGQTCACYRDICRQHAPWSKRVRFYFYLRMVPASVGCRATAVIAGVIRPDWSEFVVGGFFVDVFLYISTCKIWLLDATLVAGAQFRYNIYIYIYIYIVCICIYIYI